MERVTRMGEGRHKAFAYRWVEGVMERVTREGGGQVRGLPLLRPDGTGGTWLGETLWAGHLLGISTPGRRGML